MLCGLIKIHVAIFIIKIKYSTNQIYLKKLEKNEKNKIGNCNLLLALSASPGGVQTLSDLILKWKF